MSLSSFSKPWRVDATGDCPPPGGEPLWIVEQRTYDILPSVWPAANRGNRRLPRITQRDVYYPASGWDPFMP
jgi:hypothetical protein